MPEKIGLMVGREWSFPPAFIEEVKRRESGVTAEYVKIGTPNLRDAIPYSVIVDRFSHAVPFYRAYLSHAAARGVRVINDPRTWLLGDCFSVTARVQGLGIAVPKMVALPHREYAEGIVHEESLRNLDYPLDWMAVVEHVGLPCLLRDARDMGEMMRVCHSVDELLQHYNESGRRLLVAQEIIPWQQFVRCFIVGDEVLPLKYDPLQRKYHVDHAHLSPDLGLRIVEDSRRLGRELGLDINTVDWAIRDDVPYAVELLNPVPEIDIYALTPDYFDWVVDKLVDHVIAIATGGGKAAEAPRGAPTGGAGRPSRGEARGRAQEGAGTSKAAGSPTTADPESGSVTDLAEELPSLARDLPRPNV
jgi:hypothetical protein